MPGGPGRPLGSRNKLSEEFLRDLHVAWTTHGSAVLDRIIADRPEILFLAMTKLALIHPVEQSQPQEFDYRPRPREKVLEMLEPPEQRRGKCSSGSLRGSTSWSAARTRPDHTRPSRDADQNSSMTRSRWRRSTVVTRFAYRWRSRKTALGRAAGCRTVAATPTGGSPSCYCARC
jgi:hypothetical protein